MFSDVRLSIIVPVHNGGDDLRCCLEALAASTRSPDEVIVVDDASTDSSGDLARQHGARVIRLDGPPHGPAYARNRGAEAATGEILFFADADVVLHPDALALAVQTLEDDPSLAACFGSYDDTPVAPGLVSQYKNLLHHYVHQTSQEETCTFWAGCGAIRRTAFAAMGGFDERYTRPSIEDIELGARLRRAGYRIRLVKAIQATHLKRWTLASLIRSDVWDRALPWTRLLLRQGTLPDDLNLRTSARWSTVAVYLLMLALVLGLVWPLLWLALFPLAILLLILNADLYRFLAQHHGWWFAGGAVLLHWLYYFYSGLVFVLVAVPVWLAGHGLLLVLLATLLKGLTWSIIIPPWHAPDEHHHFLYGQVIERFQTRHVGPDSWLSQEVAYVWALGQLQEIRYKPMPLDLSDRARIAEQVALLDNPTVRQTYIYDEGRVFTFFTRTFTAFHPPLYYAALAVVQWPLERWSILIRILANRWVSVVLGVATVALAHRAGRELWPGRPGWALLLATLVSFHPMLTFCTAIIGNEALEIALFAAWLVVSLQVIRRGLNRWRGLVLGVLTGLGLLAKISFLSVLPLLGLLFIWHVAQSRRERGLGWRTLWPWTLITLLPLLLAGWWYGDAILSRGNLLSSSRGIPSQSPSVTLFPYLLRYGWLTIYRPVLHMHWGNFGWLDTPLPAPLLVVLEWITLVAVWTTGWWLVGQFTSRTGQTETRQAFTMFLLGCATLCWIAFYTYLEFHATRGRGHFGMQGRYFLPPIIGQMAWLMWGLIQPVPDHLRRAWTWLVGVGMIALNLYALFGVIAPRYYGPDDLLMLLERVTVLQPLNATALLAICTAFVALAVALVVALWGALAWDIRGLGGLAVKAANFAGAGGGSRKGNDGCGARHQ